MKNKIKINLSNNQRCFLELNQEQVASRWLTTLPITDEDYNITKQLFWDLIWIKYGWIFWTLPISCECGARFVLQHALSCKKVGFISIGHNQIWKITAKTDKRCVQRYPCWASITTTNWWNSSIINSYWKRSSYRYLRKRFLANGSGGIFWYKGF